MHRTLYILILLFLLPVAAGAEVLTSDTVWQGEVLVSEDVLVVEGVTLTILPGTEVHVQPADSTKIDPEYMSHRTEITVRGTIKIRGNGQDPVVFDMQGGEDSGPVDPWAGIIVDSGTAEISWCRIMGAEAGITVVSGRLTGEELTIRNNRYGMIVRNKESRVSLNRSIITSNDYGLFLLNGAEISSDENRIKGNSKRDEFVANTDYRFTVGDSSPGDILTSKVYRDEALPGVTVWQGRVLVDGLVRLPPEGQLIIMPGTLVEFSKRDTNNDGIGENGLMIQGRFIAKGTEEKPIIFRSAEPVRSMGDWDSINIMGSDRLQNLIEFCRIEDAYRGLHFHFANVAVTNSVLINNYRGAQFQESLVLMEKNLFYRNKSGVQARDSEVAFNNNRVISNQNGANFFRLDLLAIGNIFADNEQDGLRIREGVAQVRDNSMLGNRFGMLVADATYTEVQSNYLAGNLEAGLALRNSDHIRIISNAVQKNGLNGMIIRETRGTVSGNSIGANGERGLAIISWNGPVSGNNIFSNGLYAIGLEGASDIDARDNWWGDSDLAGEIYDSNDEAGLGTVNFNPRSVKPHPFAWTWQDIAVDAVWAGVIDIPEKVTVAPAALLQVEPGTIVRFGAGSGLEILGAVASRGTPEGRVVYTAMEGKEPGTWDEVSLQQAGESVFAYSDFSYGTWGIHSHFTSLEVFSCRFSGNYGGIRFRSGPLDISGSEFTGNTIGIRSYRGIGNISRNEITANEIGIFVREKGASLAIHRNNLHANERYDLRLGDFNRQQVDARHNWWGGGDLDEVIFDRKDESYIGPVLYDPVLDDRVDIIVQ